MIVLEGRKQDVDSLAFSPDGRELLVGGTASHVQLWDLASGTARPVLGPRGPHRASAFLTADRLITVTAGGLISVQERPFPTCVALCVVGGRNFLHAAATPDGSRLVVCGQSLTDYTPLLACYPLPRLGGPLWERSSGTFANPPFRLCTCPDGTMLVADLHSAYALDPGTGEVGRRVASYGQFVPALALSRDGSLLAVVAGFGLRVCEFATGRTVGEARSRGRKHFTDVAIHPSGRLLIASANNETVRAFSLPDMAEVAAYNWEVGPVRRVAFSPDGMRAAAAGKTGRVVLWDVDL